MKIEILLLTLIIPTLALTSRLDAKEVATAKQACEQISESFAAGRVDEALLLMTERAQEQWAVNLVDSASKSLAMNWKAFKEPVEQAKKALDVRESDSFLLLSKVIDLDVVREEVEENRLNPKVWKGILKAAAAAVLEAEGGAGALYEVARSLGSPGVFPARIEKAPEGFESEELVWARFPYPNPELPKIFLDMQLGRMAYEELMLPPFPFTFVKEGGAWRFDRVDEDLHAEAIDASMKGVRPQDIRGPAEKDLLKKIAELRAGMAEGME